MPSIVVYGAGGLGREVSLLLRASVNAGGDWGLLGFLDDSATGHMLGLPILGGFDQLDELARRSPDLHMVIAIGSSGALRAVSKRVALANLGIVLPNIVHPTATIDWEFIDSGEGNVVCAGARVNNATIGSHNIINMNVVMGHDCVLGDRNLISPSATLNGEVRVGSEVTIGAGATIMPRVEIDDGATVAIGAVVGRSVAAGDTVAGNPARVVARAKKATP